MLGRLGKGVPILACRQFVIDTNQDIAFIDDLILLDRDFLENPALQILYHLHLLRRDHRAHAAGHLVQNRKMCPHDKSDHQQADHQGKNKSNRAALTMNGRIDLAHEMQVLFLAERAQQTLPFPTIKGVFYLSRFRHNGRLLSFLGADCAAFESFQDIRFRTVGDNLAGLHNNHALNQFQQAGAVRE